MSCWASAGTRRANSTRSAARSAHRSARRARCAGTGHDGEHQFGTSVTPRFTDNGDGTVTDNLTGLIWLRDAGGLPVAFDWLDALADAAGLADPQAGLSDGSVAGDWRLPNIIELRSLVDFGQSSPLPAGHPFTGVGSAWYWSSTTSTLAPDRAWSVQTFDGASSAIVKPQPNFKVWPVRGGQ